MLFPQVFGLGHLCCWVFQRLGIGEALGTLVKHNSIHKFRLSIQGSFAQVDHGPISESGQMWDVGTTLHLPTETCPEFFFTTCGAVHWKPRSRKNMTSFLCWKSAVSLPCTCKIDEHVCKESSAHNWANKCCFMLLCWPRGERRYVCLKCFAITISYASHTYSYDLCSADCVFTRRWDLYELRI